MAILNAQKPLRNLFGVVELMEDAAEKGYKFPLDHMKLKRLLRNIERELEHQTEMFGDILNIVLIQEKGSSADSTCFTTISLFTTLSKLLRRTDFLSR